VVLALDTTTSSGSCALLRDDHLVREQASDRSRPQASRLPGELAAILDREGVALSEVDILAVGTGPGSFTGLRVGIATMQGLAMALDRPLFGISAFDALVSIASAHMHVATWVDAWRGDVYAALFEDGRQVGDPVVARPADLLEGMIGRDSGFGIRDSPGSRIPDPGSRLMANDITFIGDGAETYRDLIVSRLGHAARIADPVAPLLAGVIAVLATIDYTKGHRPPPHAIRPLYVRRPDAELARDRGPKGSAPHDRIPNPESRVPK